MNRNLFILFLFSSIAFNSANAVPQKAFPVFPARPFWFNPAALCYDSTTVLSTYNGYTAFTPPFHMRRSESGLMQSWLSSEIKLPGKFGSIGLQLGYEKGDIGYRYNSKIGSLAYANGFSLAGGRISFGIQADLTLLYVQQSWATPEDTDYYDGEDIQPDLSAGIFYQLRGLTVGISGRNLMRSTFDIPYEFRKRPQEIRSNQVINYMISHKTRLTKEWNLRASAMLELTIFGREGFTIDPQANLTAYFRDKFYLGSTYKLHHWREISANAGIRIGKADIFAIVPFIYGFNDFHVPKEYRLGLSFRFSESGKQQQNN